MPVEEDHDVNAGELGDYVPVVYAESVDEADWYRQLLDDHSIIAIVDDDYADEPPEGVRGPLTGTAVLVPRAMLEDAREVVTEVDDMEDLKAFGEDDDEDEDDDYGLGYGIVEAGGNVVDDDEDDVAF